MERFSTEQIRNVVLLGHGSCGKTSLAQSMLCVAGNNLKFPNINSNGTVFDFDSEEVKRKISIYASTANLAYKNFKINIVDTPGQPDFEGEMLEGLSSCDSAILVVSGKSGIHVGTEKAFARVKKLNIPCSIFVTKLDDEKADYFKVLEGLKTKFGAVICPIIVPFDDGDSKTFVNVPHMTAFKYKNGKPYKVELPETGHRLAGLVAAISEAVAQTNEEYFDKFFSGEQFTKEELSKGIINGIKDGVIVPVFCGSSFTGSGVDMLLDGIISYLPSPKKTEGKAKAIVFKTIADPYLGKLSYIKVTSGILNQDTTLFNLRTKTSEKIGKLYTMLGKKQIETSSLCCGDIGVIAKTISLLTNDTISESLEEAEEEKIKFPTPCYSMAVTPCSKGDETKISLGLHRLCEEDPTIRFETNPETKEQILSGLGDLHIEITAEKLKNKFSVTINQEVPKIAFREAIKKSVTAEGKHKKQTGGHGQFGDVIIRFEPSKTEELTFEQAVVGGAVPKNYFPAVQKGLQECCEHGLIAGCHVVNLKATLLDGSYHPVDSSEMAFKLAATLAFKNAYMDAQPYLLEPIGNLKVLVPQDLMGDVIGDINKRRGHVLGMEHDDESGNEIIIAQVPESEMHDFTIVLRSITKGRAGFNFEFDRYEEIPSEVATKLKKIS